MKIVVLNGAKVKLPDLIKLIRSSIPEAIPRLKLKSLWLMAL